MNIIIIGATSGIGKALAELYATQGHTVGVTGRRRECLEALRLPFRVMDVTQPTEACEALMSLIDELGGAELIVISAGTGSMNDALHFDKERTAIDVNVLGFTAIAACAYRYFTSKGRGHLVGISSLAGMRGGRFAPAYGASKAYIINYLEALRAKARHECPRLCVTDVRPGFVRTPLVAQNDKMFWVADVEKAARQMARGIARRRRVVYVTRRWRLIAVLLRLLPSSAVERI